MDVALSFCKNSGIGTWPERNMSDLKYVDDVELLSEEQSKLQVFSIVGTKACVRCAFCTFEMFNAAAELDWLKGKSCPYRGTIG